MKPLPKTVIKPAKIPAPVGKQIAKALETLEQNPSVASADAVLAAATKAPYNADDTRINAELEALSALLAADELKAATRVWGELAARWSASMPHTASTCWIALARAQEQLSAKIPKQLRQRVRQGWAWGVLSQQFQYTHGATAAKPPTDPSAAWRQGCIEITLQSFERASACVDMVRAKRFDEPSRCLDIMLCREQGDHAGALASFHGLLTKARKSPRRAAWDVLAALYIVLGLDDTKLSEEIVTHWNGKKRTGVSSIFES